MAMKNNEFLHPMTFEASKQKLLGINDINIFVDLDQWWWSSMVCHWHSNLFWQPNCQEPWCCLLFSKTTWIFYWFKKYCPISLCLCRPVAPWGQPERPESGLFDVPAGCRDPNLVVLGQLKTTLAVSLSGGNAQLPSLEVKWREFNFRNFLLISSCISQLVPIGKFRKSGFDKIRVLKPTM